MSGIGNIYADEALWQARVHWRTPGAALSARDLLEHPVDDFVTRFLTAQRTLEQAA